MEDDIDVLKKLNVQIGETETVGDAAARAWFERTLAPTLAFRRADLTTFDDRAAFLGKIKPSDRRDTAVQTVDVIGDAAFVKCVVTVRAAAGDKRYRNLRLFVRDAAREWRLLGWANEPV